MSYSNKTGTNSRCLFKQFFIKRELTVLLHPLEHVTDSKYIQFPLGWK